MNSKPRNPIDDELVASYLSGEMNRDTEIEFESKFAASEQAKQDLNNMKTKWNKISHLSDQPLPDASRAWAKLQERLIQDDLVPEQKNRYSVPSRTGRKLPLLFCCSLLPERYCT